MRPIKSARHIFFLEISFLLCLIFSSVSYAINTIQLSLEQLLIQSLSDPAIKTSKLIQLLHLKNLMLNMDIQSNPMSFTIDLSHLDLPKPYQRITQLRINCHDLSIYDQKITCKKGNLKFNHVSDPKEQFINFSFSYDALNTELQLTFHHLKIGQGTIAFNIQLKEPVWHFEMTAVNLNMDAFKPYLHYYIFEKSHYNLELLDNTSGKVNFTIQSSGIISSQKNSNLWLKSARITAQFNDVRYQYDDNMGDNIALNIAVHIKQKSQKRNPLLPSEQFNVQINMNHIHGEIFQNDLYIVPTGQEKLSAQLTYHVQQKNILLSDLNLHSKQLFNIQSKGNIALKKLDSIQKMDIHFNFMDLAKLNQLYISNIVSDSDYEGLEMSGKMRGQLVKYNNKMRCAVHLDKISVMDTINKQFSLTELTGDVYWNNSEQNKNPVTKSQLSWQQLTLNQLPLSSVTLDFSTHHNQLFLEKEVDIALFDGALHINHLDIDAIIPQSSNESFTLTIEGFIKPISLKLLSQHFNWPVLEGSLSAVIPAITYNEKNLKMGGAMMLQVFDGHIIIKDLAILDPLESYAQLSANIDLNNLDLKSLTKTYDFGEIQGRIEGKLTQLELNAWQLIAFDAYIRTPKNDKSRHQISQRAIDNLSSLGGASGLLSRSFLRFFETFRYDKIGLSCILNDQICQMSGVEKKGDSYYIVKGGGIPRIDVMGFQKQVDWHVLISRLKAIQQANEAVIE